DAAALEKIPAPLHKEFCRLGVGEGNSEQICGETLRESVAFSGTHRDGKDHDGASARKRHSRSSPSHFREACTTLESVERVCRECWHPPCLPEDWKPVPFHLCLIDEANEMSPAVQSAFLTKLDCTAPPPQTVF